MRQKSATFAERAFFTTTNEMKQSSGTLKKENTAEKCTDTQKPPEVEEVATQRRSSLKHKTIRVTTTSKNGQKERKTRR